ncbi:MAG: hypothetical protein WCO77_07695, partial [bacterium]
ASTNIDIASGAVLDVAGLTSYAMPSEKTFTFGLSSSPGRITAGSLDITSGRIILTGTTSECLAGQRLHPLRWRNQRHPDHQLHPEDPPHGVLCDFKSHV